MTTAGTEARASSGTPAIRVVAITGGIGSGKSTVAARFAALGVPTLDADDIVRELTAPGTALAQRIAAHFGPPVAISDSSFDRAELRKRVFSQPAARAWLEALLHPAVYREIDRRAAQWPVGCYGVACIPLLVETGQARCGYRVLVVDVPEAVQIERACARDGLDPATAQAILSAQASRAERLAVADDIIDNQGPPEALDAQVAALHERYSRAGADQPQYSS
jgi:dephospho-CoA kinase